MGNDSCAMRARHVVAVIAGLACIGLAGRADADPLAAGGVAAAPVPSRGTDRTPAPGSWVYVHIDSEPGLGLETYDSRWGKWLWMCKAPCDGWVTLGREFRVSGEGFKSSGRFDIDASLGQRVTLAVAPGRFGAYVAGIVMMGLGGIGIVVGGFALWASAQLTQDYRSTAVEFGASFLGAGGGLVALGLYLTVSNGRSNVTQTITTKPSLRTSLSNAGAFSPPSDSPPSGEARLREPFWRDVIGAEAPVKGVTVPIFAHSF